MQVGGINELPAEANPLSENLLINALHNALSPDSLQLIASKQQLEQWESGHGYYILLESIFSNSKLSPNIRLQAIIQIKNGVDRHWRRMRNSVIDDSEKSQIRSGLLRTAVMEPDRRLASIAALTISKIARADFPANWPEIVTEIIHAIRSFLGPEYQTTVPYQLRRALLVLLHVVKQIVLNRIGPGRVRLKTCAIELVTLLGSSYFASFQLDMIQGALASKDQWLYLEALLEQSHLSLKTIRRLAVDLIDQPHLVSPVKEFWERSFSLFQNALQLIVSPDVRLDSGSNIYQLLCKNLCGLTKLHVGMARNNPIDFVLLQSENYEIVQMHWQIMILLSSKSASASGYPAGLQVSQSVHDYDESRHDLIDKLGLQSLLLLRECIKMVTSLSRSLRYRKGEQVNEGAMSRMKQAIFTQDAVKQLVNYIIAQLLLFQPKDLREWEDEPDEWEKREELSGEDFKFAFRSCAEKLLLDLALNFKDVTLEEILKLLESVTTPGYTQVLQKEAVYCAIGLTAPVLNGEKGFVFKDLLQSNLIAEIQIRAPEYKVIRRRVAKLVGQWSTFEDSNNCRPIFYQIFQFLLDRDDPLNDQIVQVAAGRELGTTVNAWEYNAQEFMPYADNLLSKLLVLVEQIELAETKINLLSTISTIVERMEQKIIPHAKKIIDMLPTLWEQSKDEHYMKTVILTLLGRLFRSMGEASAALHPLVLPLIHDTAKPNSQLSNILMEDTLDLWSIVLQQTPNPTEQCPLHPHLVGLIQHLIPLFDQEAENLEKAIEIFEGYVALAPRTIFSREIFCPILTALVPKIGTTVGSQTCYITNAIEYALQNAVVLQGSEAMQELAFQLLHTFFFDKLLSGLKESWEAHQTTGPKTIHTKIQGITETDYLSIFSRLVLTSPQLLVELLTKSEEAQQAPSKLKVAQDEQAIDAALNWLIQEWLSHCEDVHDPGRRKLMTMAITRLLELPERFMIHHVQSLLSLWTNMILELTDGYEDRSIDSLVYRPDQFPDEDSEYPRSPDATRRSVINRVDPIHTVNLMGFVKSALATFIQHCGGEDRFRNEVLVNIDKEVIQGFGTLGIL